MRKAKESFFHVKHNMLTVNCLQAFIKGKRLELLKETLRRNSPTQT